MILHNQNAFFNHCKDKDLDVTIALNVGIPLIGKISSHDQFTVILNGNTDDYVQQVDFLNYYKKNKSVVTVVVPGGQTIQGVITNSDMYTVILNNSVCLFKNNICAINPINGQIALIFKSSITAVTI